MEKLLQIAQQIGPEAVLEIVKIIVEGMQSNPEQLQQVINQLAQMAGGGGAGQPGGGQPNQTDQALFGQ